MWRDLRSAMRVLVKNPSFTLAVILALALAIGANGAIFGLVDALWLRPPGVREPGRLVRIFATTPAEDDAPWSWPEYLELAGRVRTLEQVAVRGPRGAVLTQPDGSQQLLLVNVVSLNFFEMLGVQPAAGRLFSPADRASLDADPAVVLGYTFWQSHFGGDPAIVGRTLPLGRGASTTVRVMGVLPSSFRELEAAADRDVWLPPETWMRLGGGRTEFEQRDSRWFDMIARRRGDAVP